MTTWLAQRWVTGALFMAAALLALVPLLREAWPAWVVLIFLHSPAYMLHQVEEHSADRFRQFVNNVMFHGRDALTTPDVLVINLPLVWGTNLFALYAGLWWGPGWALVAPWVVLVNGITHIAATVKLRRANPGVYSSVLLFLPLAVITLMVVPAGLGAHVAAVAAALVLHAGIVALAFWRARRAT